MCAVTALTTVCGLWPVAGASADPTSPLTALVDTAAQRLAVAEPVAANKWHTGGPITDPARAQQVLDQVAADAAARGIDAERVRRIFTDQIDATEAIEYSRFAQWKLDPVAAPAHSPDLAASRATIDGFNRTMVAELATHWTLLRSPDCAARLGEARTGVGDARGLDAMYRQALDAATRSYCDR
ncbi:chorismate mutase [Mycobacterium manitobense]|uniref:Chorismate mutase n=1 Tax=[Mycobacterium] manitobense TaxID=190147 RepID=A0A9X2YLZ7_9MYCO|nr:chorismate mutase [[Mycobacterium] manitobense]MCV7169706.1 chorismate mutase [[Mycobacterium] manitobense]